MSLLEVVILGLCKQLPDFALFFNTHFELRKKTSLRPVIDEDGQMKFPTDVKIGRKLLKEEDKYQYYEEDITLWKELFNEANKDG